MQAEAALHGIGDDAGEGGEARGAEHQPAGEAASRAAPRARRGTSRTRGRQARRRAGTRRSPPAAPSTAASEGPSVTTPGVSCFSVSAPAPSVTSEVAISAAAARDAGIGEQRLLEPRAERRVIAAAPDALERLRARSARAADRRGWSRRAHRAIAIATRPGGTAPPAARSRSASRSRATPRCGSSRCRRRRRARASRASQAVARRSATSGTRERDVRGRLQHVPAERRPMQPGRAAQREMRDRRSRARGPGGSRSSADAVLDGVASRSDRAMRRRHGITRRHQAFTPASARAAGPAAPGRARRVLAPAPGRRDRATGSGGRPGGGGGSDARWWMASGSILRPTRHGPAGSGYRLAATSQRGLLGAASPVAPEPVIVAAIPVHRHGAVIVPGVDRMDGDAADQPALQRRACR